MVKPNVHYKELQSSYLFYNISLKTKAYCEAHPGTKLLRLGVGDVTLPLCSEVIKALHEAVEDQAHKERFHGYMPECGADFYKKVLKEYYEKRNVLLEEEEIFASSGASDELGDILDLFSADNTVLVMEPAYPAYVDANVIAGHRIIHYPSDASNGFTPLPKEGLSADMIYICSPNNPTGAVFTKEKLKKWVDFANETGAVILFDSAYEAYIKDESLPHGIYEVEGSRSCAIEISSLSKTAGFTGTRCGYTVIPKALVRQGMCFNDMWVRNRTTKTNGVSYILQRGAAAVFTPEGQRQIHENIGVYKKNAAVLMEALDRCGIRYFGGKNAPYVWMQCPNGMGGWELFDFLLEKAQIVGTPGEGFGACGTGYFRLSSFGSPEDTAEAARRIVALFGKE